MKHLRLTVIFFLLVSAISCSKKDIVIEEATIEEMIETSIEDYDRTKNKYMIYDYIQKCNYELPFHELNEMVFISPREIRLTGQA